MRPNTNDNIGLPQGVRAGVRRMQQQLQVRPLQTPQDADNGVRAQTPYAARFVPHTQPRPTLAMYAAPQAADPHAAAGSLTQPFYEAREIAGKTSTEIAQRLRQSPGNAILVKAQFDKVTQRIDVDAAMRGELSLALIEQYARLDPQLQSSVPPSVWRALARLVSRIVEPAIRQAALDALLPVLRATNWGAQLREFGGGELQAMLYALNQLGGDPAVLQQMRDAIAVGLGATEPFSKDYEREMGISEQQMFARITQHCDHAGILQACRRILNLEITPTRTRASAALQAVERLQQMAPGSPALNALEIDRLLTLTWNSRLGSEGSGICCAWKSSTTFARLTRSNAPVCPARACARSSDKSSPNCLEQSAQRP